MGTWSLWGGNGAAAGVRGLETGLADVIIRFRVQGLGV